MSTGKLQEWNEGEGAGRIKDDQSGAPLQFSSNDLRNPTERRNLHRGDKVRFEIDANQPNHAIEVGKA
ncbi:hypothetical protein AQI88_34840 [Streptomyces cellostaticus]|uniref:CSD domain-containing protein n=1 Tax=Streptomyces cellostaticus TaxID=67285 RepID=A0A101NES5_9ACTN|nr:hypothetical protein [Streptomyces cellostaticus]KUM91963.1 hypothetical protein AQI88_34840 [Streptomyces cellostaticus]GHI06880.1 hypothetical protein Scel_52010 [Streptomyces cellostaticus]